MTPSPEKLRALTNPRCIEVLDRKSAEVIRQMPGAKRMALAFHLGDMARRMIAASIQQNHPDWVDSQIQAAVAERVLRASSR
jgi:hypothetical protein